MVCISVKRKLVDFLGSDLSGWPICARFRINLLLSCNDPGRDLKRFNDDHGGVANIAAVLFSIGDIPFWLN